MTYRRTHHVDQMPPRPPAPMEAGDGYTEVGPGTKAAFWLMGIGVAFGVVAAMVGKEFVAVLGGFMLGALLILYALPCIVAANRKHANLGAITVLSILLGWTVLGWIGAMVWAFTRNRAVELLEGAPLAVTVGGGAPAAATASAPAPGAIPDGYRACPVCAEHVRTAAIKCRFCGHEFEGGKAA